VKRLILTGTYVAEKLIAAAVLLGLLAVVFRVIWKMLHL